MLAPVTVRVVEPPAQIVAFEVARVGKGFTIILTVLVLPQPKEFPEIV